MISKAIAYALGIALAAALAGLGVQSYRLNAEQRDHSDSRAAFDQERAKAAQAARDQDLKYRNREKELSDAQQKADAEAADLRAQLDLARVPAGVSADGLRRAVAAAATATLAGCTADASAELRQAAERAARVLADVHARLDRRAGILADVADQRYIAGRACERSHDEAVKATNN